MDVCSHRLYIVKRVQESGKLPHSKCAEFEHEDPHSVDQLDRQCRTVAPQTLDGRVGKLTTNDCLHWKR